MPVPYDLFDYPSYWASRQYEDNAEKIAIKRFLKIIGKKENLVDIGGGYGRLIETYLPFVKHSVLCDPSEKLLKIARKNFQNYSQIKYKKSSFPRLDFPNSTFDIALMVRVIHHLSDSQTAIKEISRILKPGGFFILEFANKVHFLARIKALFRGDFKFFSNRQPFEQRSEESIVKKRILFLNHHPQKVLSDLKENGFEIVKVFSVSNFRNPIIKRIVPLNILLFFEKVCQSPLSFLFFGPSVFVLARKSYRLDI